MFIQTEAVPGTEIMRFFPGQTVLESGSADFKAVEAAVGSLLAVALFSVKGVEGVAFDADCISVRKSDGADWQVLKPPILGVIMEHFIAGRPVMELPDVHRPVLDYGPDEDTVRAILAVITERVQPRLMAEGGEVVFLGFSDGTVKLSLSGGRFAQPVFAIKVRIENTLKNFIPAVTAVEFVHEPQKDRAGWAMTENRPGLDTPEAAAVQSLLDDRINPAVAAHGGYISLVDVAEGRAFIRLEGGCQGCGLADVTLRQGVEVEILREVPAISEVVDVTEHTQGADPYYQPSQK